MRISAEKVIRSVTAMVSVIHSLPVVKFSPSNRWSKKFGLKVSIWLNEKQNQSGNAQLQSVLYCLIGCGTRMKASSLNCTCWSHPGSRAELKEWNSGT